MTFVVSTAAWAWPQWTILGLFAFSVLTAAVFHGQPKGKWNVVVALLDVAIIALLLVFGGFFS